MIWILLLIISVIALVSVNLLREAFHKKENFWLVQRENIAISRNALHKPDLGELEKLQAVDLDTKFKEATDKFHLWRDRKEKVPTELFYWTCIPIAIVSILALATVTGFRYADKATYYKYIDRIEQGHAQIETVENWETYSKQFNNFMSNMYEVRSKYKYGYTKLFSFPPKEIISDEGLQRAEKCFKIVQDSYNEAKKQEVSVQQRLEITKNGE